MLSQLYKLFLMRFVKSAGVRLQSQTSFPERVSRTLCHRGTVAKRRDIAVIERVRTLVCLAARCTDGAGASAAAAINNTARPSRKPKVREAPANGKLWRADGKLQVASDKARSAKDHIFYGDERARLRFARERIESEVVLRRLYRPPLGFACRPCYWRRYTEPAPRVHTLCTFVTVSFLPKLERALISSSSKESACTPVPLSCLFLSFFHLGRISMPTRDVGVRT